MLHSLWNKRFDHGCQQNDLPHLESDLEIALLHTTREVLATKGKN